MLSDAQSHSELQINADSVNISQKITKEINMLKVFHYSNVWNCFNNDNFPFYMGNLITWRPLKRTLVNLEIESQTDSINHQPIFEHENKNVI